MRAVEHWLEAERLAGDAKQQMEEDGPGTGADETCALAQVHATLALAGATALQSYARVKVDDAELDDWKAAAGGES